jgi:hypothetical protein
VPYSAEGFLANRLPQEELCFSELEMYDKKFQIEVILKWFLIMNEKKGFPEIIHSGENVVKEKLCL